MDTTFSQGITNNLRGDKEMEVAVQGTEKKGFLRNEKGLTLIELLAVIVILAIIAAIAIPSIGGIIGKTKKESHRANAHIIVDAARYKVSVEGFKPDTAGGTTQKIWLITLSNDGFLDSVPKDPQGSGTYSAGTTASPAGTFVTVTQNSTTLKTTFEITLVGSSKTYFTANEDAIDSVTIS